MAITRSQKMLSASRASNTSAGRELTAVDVEQITSRKRQATVAAEPDNLFWIRISNIHEKVSYADIIRALFMRCIELKSKGANLSDLAFHFQDTIEVAFATKEDANNAVIQYKNKIQMFQQLWRITHYKPKRSLAAEFASSLENSDTQKAPKSSDDTPSELEYTEEDADVGGIPKVSVMYIDNRVPIWVFQPLFGITGCVRSLYTIDDTSDEVFLGTVEVTYWYSKDAVAAAELLNGNISFYGLTWYVKFDYTDDDSDDDDDDDDSDDDNDDDDNIGSNVYDVSEVYDIGDVFDCDNVYDAESEDTS